MKEMFTEKMLQEIFTALENGETYGYSDGNTSVEVSPNSISIRYNSMPKKENKDAEIAKFLNFCDNLNDDLFSETCESFTDGELNELQEALDTDNYRNTINVFTTRVREIANNNLTQIINEADVEIRHQEEVIKEAQATIDELHHVLDEAYNKYTI